MQKRIGILRAGAVAAIVVALGGGALASTDNLSAGDQAGAALSGSAVDHASSVAQGVLAALLGGSNPSTVVSQRGTHQGGGEEATQESNEQNDQDEVAEGQALGQSGTSGTRPGWGCGDKNHTHSGPPGRPGASPPPGCSKH